MGWKFDMMSGLSPGFWGWGW